MERRRKLKERGEEKRIRRRIRRVRKKAYITDTLMRCERQKDN